MMPSPQDLANALESNYANAKLDATITTYRRNGATMLRYKPGTLIKNSTGDTYQVQPNGSWKKLKTDENWLKKKK